VLSVVSAFLSAFLDNVTTVVLIAPVTLYISTVLRVSPLPFLISEILASNIGGTATLIGDPPNILIGSASGLGFSEFLINLGPVALVILLVFLVMTRFMFGRDLEIHEEVRDEVLALDEREVLSNPGLLRLSLLVIGGTLVGFLLATPLGLEPGAIALLGGTVLLLLSRLEVEEVLREIEWPTLFFFVGLFMLVHAVVEVGIVGGVAEAIATAADGNVATASIALLWISAIASAIVDNIPYTATAIPIVQNLVDDGMAADPLWWSLALGACLGGNLTLVGASANIVTANLAARSGHAIGFVEFMKYGSVVVVESLVISTIYVWLRYLA
jgi:Na+/H+ antiporter NhaD/arsenite permease-like protein